MIEHLWEPDRADVLLASLGEVLGLSRRGPPIGPPIDAGSIDVWMEDAARALGFEAEPIDVRYPEVERAMTVAGPAIFVVSTPAGDRLAAVVRARRRALDVLAPDRSVVAVSSRLLRAALAEPSEAAASRDLEPILARVSTRRRATLRQRLLDEQLARVCVGRAWILRPLPERALAHMRPRFVRRFGALFFLHLVEVALVLGQWWLIGKGALEGAFDRGWLGGWALLLCTQLVLHLFVEELQGEWGIALATGLQQKLLAGVTLLSPDTLRQEGTGALLGRSIEADALGDLALAGGLATMLSVVEIAATLVLLTMGMNGFWAALAFVAVLVLVAVLGVRYLAARRSWTTDRLALTARLVEQMVGHRTQLVQGTPAGVHDAADRAHRTYLDKARAFDSSATALSLAPRAWMVAGGIVLATAFVRDGSLVDLALTLGGLFYGQRALRSLVAGLGALSGAAIAWDRVRPFLRAERERAASPTLSTAGSAARTGAPAVEARSVTYRYRQDVAPALRDVSLAIAAGDRVLLEGPSGGGKSTLSALLAGLRAPTSGIVLAGGLDHRTLGETGFRRRVVLAPQFHDNHVFAESFAFNLLMGRRWPPGPEEVEAATGVCHALGLGPLLEKMPGGILQMVGNSGWQLSHGERSRMFLARALLQGAEVVVLDESFGALDPETLERCVLAVVDRTHTLVVIAHP